MILVNRAFQINSYVCSALLVVLPPALSAGAIPAGADPPGIRLLPLADGSHVVYARELLFDGTLWALSVRPCDESERGVPRVHERKSRWTPLRAQSGSAGTSGMNTRRHILLDWLIVRLID